MDPAVVGVLGTLGGAIVGAGGSWLVARESQKGAEGRLDTELNHAADRQKEQLQHDRALEGRADLRETIDHLLDAASSCALSYIEAGAFKQVGGEKYDEVSYRYIEHISAFRHHASRLRARIGPESPLAVAARSARDANLDAFTEVAEMESKPDPDHVLTVRNDLYDHIVQIEVAAEPYFK